MTSKAAQKHLFYLEMAKLLGAGFGIREAAAVLLDTRLPTVQAQLLHDLNRGLEAGNTITDAFSNDPKFVSELERSMISAGERGGSLAPAFQHLADYFGMIASAHSEAMKSMIYPIVVLHMGIFIGIVPTAMMKGESWAHIFGQLGVTLLIVYVATAIMFLLIRALLKAARDSVRLDQFLHRIPLVGKARQNIAMARFSKVYHSCLLAGLNMSETVHVASTASQSGLIQTAGKRLVKVAQNGNRLGPEFSADAAFPKAFARSYTTGEEAGTLDKDMARWANLFQTQAEDSAKSLSVMIPKLLYFIILAFVAWKIIGFFNGYYDGMLEDIKSE